MKTEAYKLYSRVFWIFLPNFIKIAPCNFELYCFNVKTFFLRHSVVVIITTVLFMVLVCWHSHHDHSLASFGGCSPQVRPTIVCCESTYSSFVIVSQPQSVDDGRLNLTREVSEMSSCISQWLSVVTINTIAAVRHAPHISHIAVGHVASGRSRGVEGDTSPIWHMAVVLPMKNTTSH